MQRIYFFASLPEASLTSIMAIKVESFANAKAAAVWRERSDRKIRTNRPKADLDRHDTMREADG